MTDLTENYDIEQQLKEIDEMCNELKRLVKREYEIRRRLSKISDNCLDISYLHLTEKTEKCLRDHGVVKICDVIKMTFEDFDRWVDIKYSSIYEIRDKLQVLGIYDTKF